MKILSSSLKSQDYESTVIIQFDDLWSNAMLFCFNNI